MTVRARLAALAPWASRQPILAAALGFTLLAAAYWGLLASHRYESEARIVLQRADLTGGTGVDFASLLSGQAGGHRADQLLMREHVLSLDMLRKLDAQLQLRAHYSRQGDWLSRLWDREAPIERLHDHFKGRASVELDEYSGVLVIRAQAYTPDTAQAITAALLAEGERHMNALGRELAQEQVRFLETQVALLGERVRATRAAVLAYQNLKGMVSPQATVENFAGIVAKLEAQLVELQTRRAGLLGYLQPGAAQVADIDFQIGAVQRQLAQERARLAAPAGKALNADAEEYQRLQLEAEFAQKLLDTALVALEKGRIEASRTLKKVQVLQAASLPESPLLPRRAYNTAVFALVALLVAGVLQLLVAIVRDHQD